jgi:hypothetical protein
MVVGVESVIGLYLAEMRTKMDSNLVSIRSTETEFCTRRRKESHRRYCDSFNGTSEHADPSNKLTEGAVDLYAYRLSIW